MSDVNPVTPDVAIPAPEAPVEAAPPRPAVSGPVWGTGRRKTSVARVRLIPAEGPVLVNERPVEQYFHELRDLNDATAPLGIAGLKKGWSVKAVVHGGGITGQAGAIRLGLSRAIARVFPDHELALRQAGFLTRDAREVERKKYGRRKARRRFQFSKR